MRNIDQWKCNIYLYLIKTYQINGFVTTLNLYYDFNVDDYSVIRSTKEPEPINGIHHIMFPLFICFILQPH